ncbi:TadA family conjugal transfer-associated ATPase [Knoellia koreensis]|jgi:pilus assembly protein CpaF|uniref:TadA family conjugal transfer-associated ATPase n=1 Tax=Knoellia koreensis TaxID=2730921 RepID=A0A849HB48_9MICO|nr:TadA family conjugal transfer-associated ATPase [Knoellia sp. DB2414S]NNM47110.1 TadA family conjugal transfer-associated ATPase [Knoellia sp. DB2414S]
MRREAVIDAQIRQGRLPDRRGVADAARADVAVLGTGGVDEARHRLAAEVLGFGPLESLVADDSVTDVLVNGDASVWVDRGDGVVDAGLRLEGVDAARRLAVRLAGLAGRRLDESQPWVDGLLPGGVRLHAILPPLVDDGAHVSLRIPRVRADGLAALRRVGMVDAHTEEVLRALVRARQSFVVSGGTGCGKTTLLAAMLAEVSRAERLVLVEDVRELVVVHPHVVRLQGRGANVEGQGAVGLVDLVRQALRMRPDRLVVGEVRGAEVREMLAALNTGHEGGAGTIHANAATDVPVRFEALGALAGMPREAVRAQLASAVRVVVHVERVPGRRRAASVSVLSTRSGGEPAAELALDCRTGRTGPGWDSLSKLLGLEHGQLTGAPAC